MSNLRRMLTTVEPEAQPRPALISDYAPPHRDMRKNVTVIDGLRQEIGSGEA